MLASFPAFIVEYVLELTCLISCILVRFLIFSLPAFILLWMQAFLQFVRLFLVILLYRFIAFAFCSLVSLIASIRKTELFLLVSSRFACSYLASLVWCALALCLLAYFLFCLLSVNSLARIFFFVTCYNYCSLLACFHASLVARPLTNTFLYFLDFLPACIVAFWLLSLFFHCKRCSDLLARLFPTVVSCIIAVSLLASLCF